MTGKLSIIQQLLHEISYEGASVSKYHQGGPGTENVLTAEVLQGLDFLPRDRFFAAFVDALSGGNGAARAKLKAQAEVATVSFLPSPFDFRPDLPRTAHTVGPDGLIETPDVYVLVEAKRMTGGSFQEDQLAREFIVAVREAKDRLPLLLLILGQEPPVAIKNRGWQAIEAAIDQTLEPVLAYVESPRKLAELKGMVHESVAWITWQTIADVMSPQLANCAKDMGADDSVYRGIARVAGSVIGAINWAK